MFIRQTWMNVELTVKRQKSHINETIQKTGRERQRTARSESEPWWRHQINWQRRTKRTRVTGKRKRQRRAHLEGKAWNRLRVGAGWHTCSERHNYSQLVTDGQWYSWEDDGMPVKSTEDPHMDIGPIIESHFHVFPCSSQQLMHQYLHGQ